MTLLRATINVARVPRRLVPTLALFASLGGAAVAYAQEALVPPRALDVASAEVPPAEFRGRAEVAVVLRITVDAEGTVTAADVVEPGGPPFDEAARVALLRSRFYPARRGETPIPARVLYRYVFHAPPPELQDHPDDDVVADDLGPPAEVAPDDVTHELGAEEEAPLGVVAEVEVEAEGVLERSAEAINVVDARAQRHRAVDLGDLLAREAGIGVQRAGGIGSSSRFSLAGLDGEQIRIFVDGVPLAIAGYPFGLANVPVSIIERVEIFRGVVPIRLGADALGGAVNLVTASTRRTFGTASYQTGSFGTYRASLIGRVYDEGSGFTAGITTFFDHAENDYEIDVELPDERGRLSPARVRRFHDAYTAFGASLDAGFVDRPWARRLLLRAFGSGFHKELQHNVVMTVPYGEVEYGEQVYGGSLVYEQDGLFGENTHLSLVTSVSRRQTDFRDVGTSKYDWLGQVVRELRRPGEIDGIASDRSIWEWTSFTRAYATWSPSSEHELRLSITPTFVTRTGDERQSPPNERDPLTAERELFTLVSGLSHRLRLFDERLENVLFAKHYFYYADTEEVLPGNVFRRLVQETHHAGAGDAFRFRFTEYLWAKASYEYAARLPSPDEIFGDGVLGTPNLALSPETSHNVNLGAQLDLQDEATTGRWRAEINLFGRILDRPIVRLPNDRGYTYQNLSSAQSLGIEASFGWVSPGRWFSLDLNGTYLDYRNTSEDGPYAGASGDRIPAVPWLFANARAAFRLPDLFASGDSLTFGWDTRYVHEFFRGWESFGHRALKDKVPSQLVHGLSISYRVSGPASVTTTLDIHNLTDERVFDFFGVQRPGRSFFLKLTADL